MSAVTGEPRTGKPMRAASPSRRGMHEYNIPLTQNATLCVFVPAESREKLRVLEVLPLTPGPSPRRVEGSEEGSGFAVILKLVPSSNRNITMQTAAFAPLYPPGRGAGGEGPISYSHRMPSSFSLYPTSGVQKTQSPSECARHSDGLCLGYCRSYREQGKPYSVCALVARACFSAAEGRWYLAKAQVSGPK